MIRFAWLQARAQTTWAVGVLAIIAAALAITGPSIVHLYNTTVAICRERGDCQSATNLVVNYDSAIRIGLATLVICVPALTGMFWGAPLVAREFEAGTFRLAWTQGATRARWLSGKLVVLGLASIAATGLLSLMVTWWASPLDHASMNVFASFDQRDIAPTGYALFAMVLGVMAGIALRRTVPAMAVTLVVYVGVRVVTTAWLRPLLISPSRRSLPLDPTSTGYGSSASGLSGLAFLLSGHRWAIGWVRINPHPGAGSRYPAHARLRRQSRPELPPARDLPAGQPLLGISVVRARDLRRHSRGSRGRLPVGNSPPGVLMT
jgi:hypothetical protein